MRDLWRRFLDALLGPHCDAGCGARLFPRDRETHLSIEHAGDPT